MSEPVRSDLTWRHFDYALMAVGFGGGVTAEMISSVILGWVAGGIFAVGLVCLRTVDKGKQA